MNRRLLLLVLSTVFPSALPGQQQPTGAFTVGSRVRLEACDISSIARGPHIRWLTGEVIHADSGALILQTRTTRVDTISPSLIASTWQSAGWRSRWVTGVRGLALGAVAGTLLGFGLDAVNDNRTGDGSGEALESAFLPILSGLLGAGIGAVVGAASGGEQWKRAPFTPSATYGCASHPTSAR
jgi:hypothetical protein